MRLIVAILALAGCNRAPLQDLPDLAVAVDLASPPDLTPLTDGPMCPRYSLEEIFITSLSLLDGEANLHTGAAIRLLAHTFSSPCEVPADFAFKVQPGNATDGIDVRVRQWKRPPGSQLECQMNLNSLVVATLGSADGLSSPLVIARDASPMGNQNLSFKVAPPPMGSNCNSSISLGNPCHLDCECQNADPASRCIPTAPQKAVCALSCNEDVDCPPALPHCNFMGSPLFTCDKSRAKPMCDEPFAFSTTLCRVGQECSQANLCVPKLQMLSRPCTCATDCSPDAVCTGAGECRIPCTTLRDCPAGAKACVGAACE